MPFKTERNHRWITTFQLEHCIVQKVIILRGYLLFSIMLLSEGIRLRCLTFYGSCPFTQNVIAKKTPASLAGA